MLLDLFFWQIPVVAGWAIEELPTHVLAALWSQMQRRRLTEINAHNYSAAVIADLGQAQAEKRKKLLVEKWLPYDLGDGSDKPRVSERTIRLLEHMQAGNLIPPAMLRDLYKYKIIEPS